MTEQKKKKKKDFVWRGKKKKKGGVLIPGRLLPEALGPSAFLSSARGRLKTKASGGQSPRGKKGEGSLNFMYPANARSANRILVVDCVLI